MKECNDFPPRKVIFKEVENADSAWTEYLHDGNLVPLKDLPFVSTEAKATLHNGDITLNTRQRNERYGIFLGGPSYGHIPEVVWDQEGCYTLIFKKKKS